MNNTDKIPEKNENDMKIQLKRKLSGYTGKKLSVDGDCGFCQAEQSQGKKRHMNRTTTSLTSTTNIWQQIVVFTSTTNIWWYKSAR